MNLLLNKLIITNTNEITEKIIKIWKNINPNKNALKGDSDIFSNLLKNLENEDFLNQEIRILSEDLAKNPDAFNYVTRGTLYLLLKK